MAEYNFFDLLKLKPFPRLPGKEEILYAAGKWERDTRNMANSANTPKDQKEELMGMVKTLPAQMQAFASDEKEQNRQREQFREQHCKQLAVVAGQMKKYSGTQIRDGALRRIARESGLNEEHVTKVFQDSGFEIQKSTEPAQVLPKPKDLDVISSNLARLRDAQARGVGNIPIGIGSVTNLYEYLEAMLGKEQYQTVNTGDFRAIQAQFKSLSVSHARGVEPISFFRNIESMAAATFFNSDQSKAMYDRYIKLQKSGLGAALDAIRGLPESLRISPSFAKNWVSNIHKELGVDREEEAYQIYNNCCNIPSADKLEKEDTQIITICSCGHRNRHDTFEEAVRAKCANPGCGLPLYKACPSCGKKVRNSTEICAFCGYHVSDRVKFDRAVALCKSAIEQGNSAEASKQLAIAQETKPQNASIKDLEEGVEKLAKSIGSAMGRIEQLIVNGKLNDAQREMAKLRASNPGVNLSELDRKIERKRTEIAGLQKELDQKMRLLSGKPVREQVNVCMDILARDESYEPALEHLRLPAMAPKPVSNVQATADSASGAVSIAWVAHPENSYVTYTVVRSSTPTALTSPKQGVLVAENLKVTACKDSKAEVGVPLYYAVFAVRDTVGAWSSAARSASPALLLPGLRSFEYSIVNSDCVLRWEPPAKCAGVRLERAEVGGARGWETIQRLCIARTYTDKNLRMNAQYSYRCTPIWNVAGQERPSPGSMTVNVSLEKRPDPVVMRLKDAQAGGYVMVDWQTNNQGQMEIWSLKPGITPKPGTVMEYRDMRSMGDPLWKGLSSMRQASFSIGADRQCNIIAASSYGAQVILGQTLLVSTIQPMNVSWDKMRLAGNQLSVQVTLPARLKTLLIYVDDDTRNQQEPTSKRPFMTLQPDRQGVMEVNIPNLPEREVRVAIAGVLMDGAAIPAAVHRVNNKPKAWVSYLLEWKRGGFFGRGGVSGLQVTLKTSASSTPHALLCYNRSNPSLPIALGETEYRPDSMCVLVEIQASQGVPKSVTVPEADVQSLPQGTRLKLLLAQEAREDYDNPRPEDAKALEKPSR